MSKDHLFYEKVIIPDHDQEFIRNLLKKYKKEKANEELKEKIYNDLCDALHHGHINTPLKVILKKDLSGIHPDYIEILLDTRV